jgi:5-methyltetrahydropteroyltriglutamate--homocysteine methyltransferase
LCTVCYVFITSSSFILIIIIIMKVSTSTLGFPRMGPNRELKFALEKHWKGVIDEADLMNVAHAIEEQGWALQKKETNGRVTVGDYYLYDGVLTWINYLGVVPKRHQKIQSKTARMFAMARGVDGATALSKLLHVAIVFVSS